MKKGFVASEIINTNLNELHLKNIRKISNIALSGSTTIFFDDLSLKNFHGKDIVDFYVQAIYTIDTDNGRKHKQVYKNVVSWNQLFNFSQGESMVIPLDIYPKFSFDRNSPTSFIIKRKVNVFLNNGRHPFPYTIKENLMTVSYSGEKWDDHKDDHDDCRDPCKKEKCKDKCDCCYDRYDDCYKYDDLCYADRYEYYDCDCYFYDDCCCVDRCCKQKFDDYWIDSDHCRDDKKERKKCKSKPRCKDDHKRDRKCKDDKCRDDCRCKEDKCKDACQCRDNKCKKDKKDKCCDKNAIICEKDDCINPYAPFPLVFF